MDIIDKRFDGGKAFDWGKTSQNYAKFRDIYPQRFYEKIVSRGLCIQGQHVLDVGTGTGVLPRNMYRYGAKWTGTDLSEEQIAQAKRLSKGMDIDYYVSAAECTAFSDQSFDVITACQCFWYFDPVRSMPNFYRMLKPDGRLLVLSMAWLPFEDRIAEASEKLVLKYNPTWSGAGETVHPIPIPKEYDQKFERIYHEEYRFSVPFTRESWNGRMKTCRGIGASLTKAEISAWETEHKKLLSMIAPNEFEILHYAAIAELKKKPLLSER